MELGRNPCIAPDKRTWCAWTTFERLAEDSGYWTAALPLERELLDTGTADGGSWGQPFRYDQIAHLILPRRYCWEQISYEGFTSGVHTQDVESLSKHLAATGIPHRLTELVLEIKLY
jgi:hypothetical protein